MDHQNNSSKQVRVWQQRALLLFSIVFVFAAANWYTIPGSIATQKIERQNQLLEQNLAELEAVLPRFIAIHERLSMYESQLKTMSDIQPKTKTNVQRIKGGFEPEPLFGHDVSTSENSSLDVENDGPESGAASWVESVITRIKSVEASFKAVEPNLNYLVAELEDLEALQQAIPNRWPILGIHGSGFGWRKNPVTKRRLFHKGIDISAKYGTPIFATAPGTVRRAGWMRGYGRNIDLQHGYGIMTRYAHCSRIKVRKGDTVERGDLIGWVGQTGRATGPHVHFEIHIDGAAVDPTEFIGE